MAYDAELRAALEAARAAGQLILEAYAVFEPIPDARADISTDADRQAHNPKSSETWIDSAMIHRMSRFSLPEKNRDDEPTETTAKAPQSLISRRPVMPNTQAVDYDWAKHRVSVAEVEKLTGLKFWPALPEGLAKELKAKTDEVKVKTPKSK